MTTLREKPIKFEANVVRHAKAVTFQLADVAMPRALFAAILGRIAGCVRDRSRSEGRRGRIGEDSWRRGRGGSGARARHPPEGQAGRDGS